ncbi:hypothetical protein AGOR_G00251240 [Albula goreensis]|uniref:Anaphylatoxin-like domain-containing protein n=1 Tax=Albula goreensis TaxID=1534307 RepID=A0A8T3CHG9_9TELE|nr:hypothetical protein AGOR_G00251240 [Albula goreensis]
MNLLTLLCISFVCGFAGAQINKEGAGVLSLQRAEAGPQTRHPHIPDEARSAVLRSKRAIDIREEMIKKILTYRGELCGCCRQGMKRLPPQETCITRVKAWDIPMDCQRSFIDCCEFLRHLKITSRGVTVQRGDDTDYLD